MVIQTMQTSRIEPMLDIALGSPDQLSATAKLVALEPGLYAVEIGESPMIREGSTGLKGPAVQVSAPHDNQESGTEIIGASGRGDSWLGPEGGTVIVKSPPGGGNVLVTAYGFAAEEIFLPDIQLRRLDRPRSAGAAIRSPDPIDEPEEIQSEIVLHMERLGDRRFPGQGWVGNRGKRLRIEAFSIRPLDTLLARDIEFKALGPKGRQTPWVTDAKLCGTRAQGLPLTGFAIRLAPHAAERFDVVYEGAFFESGVVGPQRNGELCMPPIGDDPLEAINVRVIRRSDR